MSGLELCEDSTVLVLRYVVLEFKCTTHNLCPFLHVFITHFFLSVTYCARYVNLNTRMAHVQQLLSVHPTAQQHILHA